VRGRDEGGGEEGGRVEEGGGESQLLEQVEDRAAVSRTHLLAERRRDEGRDDRACEMNEQGARRVSSVRAGEARAARVGEGRTRRDGVDADVVLGLLVGERAREGDDRALGRCEEEG